MIVVYISLFRLQHIIIIVTASILSVYFGVKYDMVGGAGESGLNTCGINGQHILTSEQ